MRHAPESCLSSSARNNMRKKKYIPEKKQHGSECRRGRRPEEHGKKGDCATNFRILPNCTICHNDREKSPHQKKRRKVELEQCRRCKIEER